MVRLLLERNDKLDIVPISQHKCITALLKPKKKTPDTRGFSGVLNKIIGPSSHDRLKGNP